MLKRNEQFFSIWLIIQYTYVYTSIQITILDRRQTDTSIQMCILKNRIERFI